MRTQELIERAINGEDQEALLVDYLGLFEASLDGGVKRVVRQMAHKKAFDIVTQNPKTVAAVFGAQSALSGSLLGVGHELGARALARLRGKTREKRGLAKKALVGAGLGALYGGAKGGGVSLLGKHTKAGAAYLHRKINQAQDLASLEGRKFGM